MVLRSPRILTVSAFVICEGFVTFDFRHRQLAGDEAHLDTTVKCPLLPRIPVTRKTNWDEKYNCPKGIINVGNDCYMLAALQSLASLSPMMDESINNHHIKKCIKNKQGREAQCVACELINQLREINGMNSENIRGMRPGLKALVRVGRARGQQECAMEYMSKLLEAASVADSQESKANQPKFDSFVHQIFGWLRMGTSKCAECGSAALPAFDWCTTVVTCPSVKTLSLQDLLSDYFSSFPFQAAEPCKNLIGGDWCKSKERIRETCMAIPPNVLQIDIARAQVSGIKYSKKIQIPRILHLSTYQFAPWAETVQSDIPYNLYAFVVHKGSTIHAGHYIAVVCRNGLWYEVDDASTKCLGPALPGNVNAATILFYIREQPVVPLHEGIWEVLRPSVESLQAEAVTPVRATPPPMSTATTAWTPTKLHSPSKETPTPSTAATQILLTAKSEEYLPLFTAAPAVASIAPVKKEAKPLRSCDIVTRKPWQPGKAELLLGAAFHKWDAERNRRKELAALREQLVRPLKRRRHDIELDRGRKKKRKR